MKIVLAGEARALGLKKYFTGKPCPAGHYAQRLVSNGCCTECLPIAQAKHRLSPENRQRGVRSTIRRQQERRRDPLQGEFVREKDRRHKISEKAKRTTRQYVLRTQMNASIELVEAVFAAQDYKCRICKTDLKHARWGKKVCDHDHLTGQFRSVLCCKCNAGLGYFNEDLDLLKNVMEYLTAFHDQLRARSSHPR